MTAAIAESTERLIEPEPNSGCWIWSGARHRLGYAVSHGKYVHRRMYERLRGPIPQGTELDHQCRNRACVNPEHLRPVTHRENVLLGDAPTAIHARQTHCKHGHPLTADNLVRGRSNRRECLICWRRHAQTRNEKARVKRMQTKEAING